MLPRAGTNAQITKLRKKAYCPYCSESFIKLPLHMETVHKTEPDILLLKKLGHRDRLLKLTELRNKGAASHNETLAGHERGFGSTGFQVKYKPKCSENTSLDYILCGGCHGFYHKKFLWKHQRRCALCSPSKKGVIKGRALQQMPIPATTPTKIMLKKLRMDPIGDLIIYDQLLVRFAERLSIKGEKQYAYSRNALRELARLIEQVRKLCNKPKINMKSLLDPLMYHSIVEAAKLLSQDGPSLGMRLGHNLVSIAQMYMSDSLTIDSSDKEAKRDGYRMAKDFKTVMQSSWSIDVAAGARRTLYANQKNRPNSQPTASDVKILNDFLKKQVAEALNNLNKQPSQEDYAFLQKKLLCLLVIFNRKRAGEASKMTLDDYQRGISSADAALAHNLNEYQLTNFEKELLKRYKRIEITGKRGRHVPLILTPLMSEGLETLATLRKSFLSAENPYFFGQINNRSDESTYIRCTDVLRQCSEECGASHPETLRSTKLRKQIATQAQILNLQENDIGVLASFMGHSKKVHRDFYRLPSDILQVTKVTKVLLAMESGTMKSLEGKSLDQIDDVSLDAAYISGNIRYWNSCN